MLNGKFAAPGPDKNTTRAQRRTKILRCSFLRSLADTKCYFRNVKSTLRTVQPSKCMDIGQHSFLTNFFSIYCTCEGEKRHSNYLSISSLILSPEKK